MERFVYRMMYLGTSLFSVYGEFSIEQFILAPQLSHLTFQVLHALLEACNLRILGLLAFPLAWLGEQWLWRRQFSQAPNFLSKICMARVIEKRLGNVGDLADRREVNWPALLLELGDGFTCPLPGLVTLFCGKTYDCLCIRLSIHL
jgi:hypothetical protein